MLLPVAFHYIDLSFHRSWQGGHKHLAVDWKAQNDTNWEFLELEDDA